MGSCVAELVVSDGGAGCIKGRVELALAVAVVGYIISFGYWGKVLPHRALPRGQP